MSDLIAKGVYAALCLLFVIAVSAVEATYYLRKIAKTLSTETNEWFPGATPSQSPGRIVKLLETSFGEERLWGVKRHYWTVLAFAGCGIGFLVWINHLFAS